MTNKERAAIIRQYFDQKGCCRPCEGCPSSGVVCNVSDVSMARQKFFNEVADILENAPNKVKVREHNENRN